MRFGGYVEDVAVGGDELDREQVVGGEPVLRHQPAEAAAERQAGNARRRDGAARDREAVLGRGGVELRPEHAALGRRRSLLGIDRDRLQLGEIDHHAAVGDGAPGDVVAAAADRHLEPGRSGVGERRDDVRSRVAADDEGRPAVDQPVVHSPGGVVSVVVRAK